MIFTSNYKRHGTDANAIAISIRPPASFKGKSYPKLAPTWDLVMDYKKGIISSAEYSCVYMDLIIVQRRLNAHQVIQEIGESAILLCYEEPKDFCHRRLVADWLSKQTKVKIQEFSEYEEMYTINKLFD